MSKSSSKSRKKRPGGSKPRSHAAHDRAVYVALIMIGAFVVLLAVPLTGGTLWRHVAVAYVLLMAIMINLFAWRAYAGGRLARWQASLARMPLRWVGYGIKGGKPIEAAHDKPEVRRILIASTIISIIAVALLAVLVIPGLV